MSDEITYAKAGVTPENWRSIWVFDGDKRLNLVDEVDTVASWAKCFVVGESGEVLRDGTRPAYAIVKSPHLRIVEDK